MIETFRYFIKRVLMMLPTLLAIILVVMLLLDYVPGAGIRSMSSESGNNDVLDSVLDSLNLQGTFLGRYVRFVYEAAHGNFGSSRQTNGLTRNNLLRRAEHTLIITGCGAAASLIFGVPLGFTAALHSGRGTDHAVSAATLLISSVPSYCVAVACSLVFVLWLRVLPLYGYETPAHYVMPTIVAAVPGIAIVTAMMRSSVLNVLGQQYISVLYAAGIGKARILWIHVMKNAMVTFLSSFQNVTLSILCSGMIAENFFTVPGLGNLLVNSVTSRSPYNCLACVVFFGIFLMAISLLNDLLCCAADPKLRRRLEAGGKR